MLVTVTVSFLHDLKIKSFVLDSFNESLLALSQSVILVHFSLFTTHISEGHLLPNDKLVASAE